MISEENIKKKIYSENTLIEAESIIKEKNLDVQKPSGFWKGEAALRGTVAGFRCKVSIDGNELSNYQCQCGKAGSSKGICKHIAAMALYYTRESDAKNQRLVYTSPQAGAIIGKSKKRALACYQREEDVYNLGLAYDISLNKDVLSVEFYITSKKAKCYIENLDMFEEYFISGASVSYSSKISVKHHMDSFKDEFRPMVAFMLRAIMRKKESDRASEGQVGRYVPRNPRVLQLFGDDIDAFMELCLNSGGTVIFKDKERVRGEKRNLIITDNNPDITLRIDGMGRNGYQIGVSGLSNVICGYKHIYVVEDSYLYMADEGYSLAMKEFLTETVKAQHDRMRECFTLVISKNDMPSFCNLVVSNIKGYCKVVTNDVDLEQFNPWELECSFNLNLVGSGRLECDANLSYRGEEIDIDGHVSEFSGVCRDYLRESKLMNILSRYFKTDREKNIYYADEYRQIYGLIKSGIRELEAFGEVNISEQIGNYKIEDSMKINASVSTTGSWLKLDIDAGEYTREELQELLDAFKRKEKYICLNGDTFVKLDNNGLELLAQMAYDLDFSAADIVEHQVFIPKYRALYIDGRLREGVLSAYDRDAAFKSLVRTIKQVEDSEFIIPEELVDTLRGYQKYGFHWLRALDACGFGGILADDMGLGKTLQIITLLLDEKLSVSRKVPSLVIAPSSLIYNWENEIKRFAPMLDSVIVAGTKSVRRDILNHYSDYDVLITSYDLLKRDIDMYKDMAFRFQVIDEAQNIKNYATDNAKSVKKINAQTRFALTGTPIENRLSELWSIFDFLMPGFLYTYPKFREKFERPIMAEQEVGALKGLTRMISPFVLRRLKKDVLKELPEKLEYDIYTKLEGKQHKLYVANAMRLKKLVEGNDDDYFNDNRMEVLSELMNLRQLCCDPSLCYDDYDGESSKLEMCVDMVKTGMEAGHKILLFSQFTSMLDIIAKRFDEENISYYTLTGSTPKDKRLDMVDRFNKDETNVFLISLKAGGVGLNLTGADMVIHYDPWWNVAAENQAADRAHRIGQDKVVSVFRLISKDTVEESIRGLQRTKAKLADDILGGETISLGSLSKKELLSILES